MQIRTRGAEKKRVNKIAIPKEGVMSMYEVALMFNVNPMTIRRHIAMGKLKAFRVGSRIKISAEALQEYIKNNHIAM